MAPKVTQFYIHPSCRDHGYQWYGPRLGLVSGGASITLCHQLGWVCERILLCHRSHSADILK
jgi:hypothetical protein